MEDKVVQYCGRPHAPVSRPVLTYGSPWPHPETEAEVRVITEQAENARELACSVMGFAWYAQKPLEPFPHIVPQPET
jgi:hypothetical protein